MENSKELFIKAFMEAEQISYAEFMNTENENISFTDKFEKEMDKMLKKDKCISYSSRRKIRKGLVAAVIAIIIAFTGLMSVSATRMPFIKFSKKIFAHYNEISLSDESKQPLENIETEYTLDNIPSGFEMKEYQKLQYLITTTWENESKEQIVFSQQLLDATIDIDNEHEYKELSINGYKAYYANDDYGSFLLWTDGYYWFTISAPVIREDEIINMAENISEKN